MKPHLPLSLITALLLSMPMAQAVDIPDTYEQVDLWTQDYLGNYTNNTQEEAYAFLLYTDVAFTPESYPSWTGDTPLVTGGQLLFTTAEGYAPQALSFSRGASKAFYAPSALRFDTLSRLSFDSQSTTGSGAAIYLRENATLTIAHVDDHDDSTADVIFSGNSASGTGGAALLALFSSAIIQLHNNGSILFTENEANYSGGLVSGGAIYSAGMVSFHHNHSVILQSNTVEEQGYSNDSKGGAVCASTVEIIDNEAIQICDNTANSRYGKAYGGAIYASTSLGIRANTSVLFKGNKAENFPSTYSGSVEGGALYSNTLTISEISESVIFKDNSVLSYGASYGGAISGSNITIQNNHIVKFYDNKVYSKFPNNAIYDLHGGAIYASRGLSILGNDSVSFEKNYERISYSNTTRLRSLYVGGSLNLSAKTGGDITFYDSVYVTGQTRLNAAYQDAEGVSRSAGGDVVFSGRYTAEHLREIKGSDATEAEISASRTSTLGTTELCGGSLHIVDGAVVKANRFTVLADSAAKLLMRDGTLSCSGNNITLNSGNTLELQGSNSLTADRLTLGSGTTLVAHLSEANLSKAALKLGSNTWLESSQLTLQIERSGGLSSGLFRIIGLSSPSYFAPTAAWNAENIQVVGSGDAARASFADLLWQNGTLYYRVGRNLWDNGSGDGLWNSRSDNWSMNDRRYTYADGMDVSFTDTAAGELRLAGELRPADILVHNSEGQDYRFTAAEGGGYLAGSTGITKEGSGELALATDNRHTGDTVLNGGTLRVQHSRALGATAEGLAAIRSAAGTALVIENGSRVVLAGSNALAGAVSVAEGAALELRHTGYNAESSAVQGELRFCGAAADTTAGSLSGSGSVLAEDSRVSFGSLSGFTGNLRVSGKNARLSVSSGNYNGSGSLIVRGSGAALDLGSNNLSLRSGGSLALSSDGEAAQLMAKNVSLAAGASLSTAYLLPESSELGQDLFLVSNAESEELTGVFNSRVSASLDCSLLTLTAGSSLSLQGGNFGLNGATLTLAVTPTATQKIELTLVPMDAPEAKVLLFTEVGKVNFIYDNQQPSSATGGLHSFAAADYFSGAWIHEDTQLIYDAGAQQLYLTQVNSVVPEPSSATLSLTALAALLLRRRRR